MRQPDTAQPGKLGLWLPFVGCVLLVLASVYAFVKAEQPGDVLMAALAVLTFACAAAMVIHLLLKRRRMGNRQH